MRNETQEQVEREKAKKDLVSKINDGVTTGLALAAPLYSFTEGFCTNYFSLEPLRSLTPLFLGVPAGFLLGLRIDDDVTPLTAAAYTCGCYILYNLGSLLGGYLK